MKADLDRIADQLARQARELAPMQVAGGRLDALAVRRLVGVLEMTSAQARMAGRRVQELLRLIVAHGEEPPPAPPRPTAKNGGLRLVEGGRKARRVNGTSNRYRFREPPEGPDGPAAA
jgi:hypothetical protein